MKRIGANNPFAVNKNRQKPATERQIAKLERRLNARLPEEYRQFLLTINGGSRANGGWELPKQDLNIGPFLSLGGTGYYDLAERVELVLTHEQAALVFPADTIPIADEFADCTILLKYRGKDVGAIGYRSGGSEEGIWKKLAPSFNQFIAMLHQEPERAHEVALREMFERDDVTAMRRHLDAQPNVDLEKPVIESNTLLQLAAHEGAVKIVKLLLDRGARKLKGLGIVNNRNQRAVTKLLLNKAGYKPRQYDWLGASCASSGMLQVYFDHAAAPSRSLLASILNAAKNRLKSKPSKDQEKVIRMLEQRLAATPKRGQKK